MQRYFALKKQGEYMILENSDLYHIQTVMRMKNNDKIEVVFNGKLYLCTLSFIGKDIQIKCQKKEIVNLNEREITLIIPILKEQKMDLILQKSTELGVSRIIPFIAERSIIKVSADKEIKKIQRWRKICKEASEQSKRITIPIIEKIHTIQDIQNMEGIKIICSTYEKSLSVKSFLQSLTNCDKINIIIGPEGGFSLSEEEKLIKGGFVRVTLGNRILRVETVPLFLLSVINYEYME